MNLAGVHPAGYFKMRRIGRSMALGRRGLGVSSTRNDGFSLDFSDTVVSEEALRVAREIRGERPPTLIIHGVMQRSGTNYTGELLRLHPNLYGYPNKITEVPFLQLTKDIIHTQNHFFQIHIQNSDKIGNKDFLPLFGASFIAYLYSFVPAGRRMLLKVPSVEYLKYFFSMFPYETPLLLLRDGRDLVTTTINTWPQKRFEDVCRSWVDSVNMILAFQKHYPEENYNYLTVKYEDIVSDPDSFITTACERYSLDRTMYPYGKIKDLPVIGSSTIGKEGKEVVWKGVSKPKDFNPVGQWGNWSSRQKRVFKDIAGKALVETAYCADFNW